MKLLTTIFNLMVLALIANGCGTPSSESDSESTTVQTHETADSLSNSLSLNDGEKWKVNEEMKPFIEDSEKMLQDFNRKNAQNYAGLAKALKEKNTGLIKSCTMKGESHDELHKWLHPHMELIEELGTAESNEEARALVADLEKSFKAYNQYFK